MHAFVRRRDGIQTFDYPDADVFMTQAFNINDRGDIAGWFQNSAGSHGFVRDATGRFVSIDYPGAFLTRAFGINNRGVVVGYFQMARGAPAKGFTWSNGKFSVFDVPDSVGVAPQAINDTGAIAGYYRSADGAFHGFIATP
jgi:probable HAF family extracellular repeat protein